MYPKNRTILFYNAVMHLKEGDSMANCVDDSDKTAFLLKDSFWQLS